MWTRLYQGGFSDVNNFIVLMDSQALEDLNQLKAASYKHTVESLLVSIEKKAEANPETAEESK